LSEIGVDLNHISIHTPIIEIIEGINDLEREEIFKILDEVFSNFEEEAAEEAELRDHVKEVLLELKKTGVKLAIASNNSMKSVEKSLEKTSIKEFFDIIITRNDVIDLKPSEKMITEILRIMKVTNKEAVYIGDTIYDILAARRAGVKCIAVTGGANSKDLLLSHNPDYLVEDLREIPRIISRLKDNHVN
ncbi:MAG: HAD family hydrolase, partial [Nitrososphaerota archaeon]